LAQPTLRGLALGLLLALLSAPALAQPPAALTPEDGHRDRVLRSFHSFAADWMNQLGREEASQRRQALSPQGPAQAPSYRGVGRRFDVELRATGNAQAPFVGILRYPEYLYSCAEKVQQSCQISSRNVISEIFRLQDGRWIY
jgi:hypothetical protein